MHKKIGRALVVGAGIGGIRSALDLAESGYSVTLIDRSPHIGGVLSQLDQQFPTNHCGMCRMLPLVERDAGGQFCLRKGLFHENIDILLGTEAAALEGEPGHFTVTLHQQPAWVDPHRCTGCGVCTAVCPVDVLDEFNVSLGLRKAIYLPVPHQIPNPYAVDLAACTRCGACEAACPTAAISISSADQRDFRILVVDDEQIVRDSLRDWLEDEGFEVDTAESGEKALEQFSARQHHLLLTDVKMPGMDGVEVLERVKALAPETTVVMMTAYATVDTAVAAMKIGALDYLVKPFDPDQLVAKVLAIYQDGLNTGDRQIEVGAVVLACGTGYFDPRQGHNTFGYGSNPHVFTSLELERILSGTGPTGGRLVRPADRRPIEKIAWLQCVGSRDLQCDADFCSSICCMISVKEAMLVKEKGGAAVDTAIFYMDMRTFAKPFQRYRDRAEQKSGVRFLRARVHSVTPAAGSGDPCLRYVGLDGEVCEEVFDAVVLAVGQRPSPGTDKMAEMMGLAVNDFGFVDTPQWSPVHTGRDGILASGSCTGLKDIAESVVSASAAAAEAGQIIHAAGGSLAAANERPEDFRDVTSEPPRILVAVCRCAHRQPGALPADALAAWAVRDTAVVDSLMLDQACTADGWQTLTEAVAEHQPNRLLLAACHPYVFTRQLRDLGRSVALDPSLMEAVDIFTPTRETSGEDDQDPPAAARAAIGLGLARLRHRTPAALASLPVSRRALVIGGGIGGLTAALAIADRGYPVDLVEKSDRLGGHLHWIETTLEGRNTATLLSETVDRVTQHPNITVHLAARVNGAFGTVGQFSSVVTAGERPPVTLDHGVALIATGGREAPTEAYGCGSDPAVVTQQTLARRLAEGQLDPQSLNTVVMIQCVESREEPRNYCSRVCCATSLKQALALKRANPDIAIFVLYRDMMTTGFTESYFSRARENGVVFVPYTRGKKPSAVVADGIVTLTVDDPVLGRPLQISADLLVLATGVTPSLPPDLAAAYGAECDEDGFFQEADAKWRPVDSLKEGVFGCGLALGPRNIQDTLATAGAAAQRALRILERRRLPAARPTSTVRHALCARCERCIQTCPYGARSLDIDGDRVRVDPAMCQGCGACAAVCPNGAAILEDHAGPMVFEMIDQALASISR
jgi:heterodisulfide reductase subunit A